LGLDRPLAQCDIDRARQLVAVERFALAVLFEHGQFAQLDPLERREARRATAAKPPPPDRASIVGRSRILDLGVIGATERATHVLLPLVVPAFSGSSHQPRAKLG